MTYRLNTPGMKRRAFLALGLAATAGAARGARAQDAPVIAAASDLKFALTEIEAAFRAETGKSVKLVFGSTGNFAAQIRHGAPFQLFLAADESFIADLHRDGFTRDAGDLYAVGRLALIAPPGSPLKPDATMDNLDALLKAGGVTRFAIASPDHAPYGMRAREALVKRGLWDRLKPFLVLGENVNQAAQFALSGNAQGGLVAWSLALASELRGQTVFAQIPQDWHQPLRQRMALMKNAGPVAAEFHACLKSPQARRIMQAYGFELPQKD